MNNKEQYKKLLLKTIELNFRYTKIAFMASLLEESIKQDVSAHKYLILAEKVFSSIDLLFKALFNAESKEQLLYIKDGKIFKCTSEGLTELSETEISNLVLTTEPEKE
jgi:hypothetical protein